MKSKILLSCTLLLTVLMTPSLFAQNDEYYRPDSLRREAPGPTREYTPSDTNRLAEKRNVVDFKQLPFKDRLRAGGGFGLSLGTFTNINLSPMAGYELTEKLVGGIGITYMFFKQRYFDSYSYYGGKGFLMYNVIRPVNLIAELEPLNVVGNYQRRQWIVSPMLGAAYSVPTGGRIAKAVHFTLLYNLNYYNQVDNSAGPAAAITNLSPYGSPLVSELPFCKYFKKQLA